MESIGLAVATERFGATFFGNGATFGGIVSYPAGLSTNDQTRKENREVIASRHQGVDRSHRLLTLYEGATYQQLGVQPDHAQFLETRRFQIEEAARWFNLPVHKLKELARSTNNNIEHQGIEYATDTLQPWFRMWEGELRLKLVPRLERKQQFFEHITEALTRGDSAAQGQLISQQFQVGAITPNEIRAKFNYNPRADGNDIQLPAQNMPADLHREYWSASVDLLKAQAEKAREPTPVPQPPPVAPKADDSEEVKSLREQVALARHATSLAEELRDKAQAELAQAHQARDMSVHADKVLRDADRQAHDEAIASIKQTLAEADLALAHTSEIASRLKAQLAETEDALDAERAAHAATERRRAKDVAAAEGMVEFVRGEHDAEGMRRLDAEQALEKSQAQLAETEGALEAERAAHARTEQQRQEQVGVFDALDAAHGALRDVYDQERAAHDSAKAIASDLLVSLGTAEKALAVTEDQRDAAEKQAKELQAMAREVAAQREALRGTTVELKQHLSGAEMALETERQQHRAQRAAVLASMRALFVDATDRLLQKESDRARKHQTTPEKLRAWVDTFYPMHVETVRHAFRPIVSAWVVVTGADAGEMVERLVTEHIDGSKRALMHVLDSDDEDLRAATLERTLRRWEEERADAMADALVREGMGQ
jgi:hypothetical protein